MNSYPPKANRCAGQRTLACIRAASGTLSALAGGGASLLGVLGVLLTVLLPTSLLAAPPAITPSTQSVSVHPTTGAVVNPANRQLIQTFIASGRAAAAPVAAGQLGWEIDTHILLYSTSTTAGAWSEVVPDASETVKGKLELATQAEVDTGSDTTRAVTPATLKSRLDAMTTDTDSGFKISSNGAGGFKLELWNADQGIYQEVRIAGASGAERLVIAPAP